MPPPLQTRDAAYADRLERLGEAPWKRLLDVQRPYRWHMRSLKLGRVLDLGCGVGRNLGHLQGVGVGVDHNAMAVARCRTRGLVAYEPDDFRRSDDAQLGGFDSLLCSHVVEHMRFHEAVTFLAEYLPYVRSGGRVVLIAPQEAGQRSDPTHVEFLNLASLYQVARQLGLPVEKAYSFPFPRPAGFLFKHNESVIIARKP